MKLILRLFAMSLITSVVGTGVYHSANAASSVADSRVYELRTYTAHPGKFEAVLARFRDHTTKLFEKQGMINLGYWVPLDAADGAVDQVVILIDPERDPALPAALVEAYDHLRRDFQTHDLFDIVTREP